MKDKSLMFDEHMPTYFGVDDADCYRECYLIARNALQNIIDNCEDVEAVSIAENAISDAKCVMLGRG